MDCFDEEWKKVPGFEEEYEISNYGRLKSIKQGFPKIIKGYREKNGYIHVVLTKTKNYKEIKRRSTRIHRLVAESFIPNPNNYQEINHIDMVKTNNIISNLEWCDRKYNIKEAIKYKPNIIEHLNIYNKYKKTKRIIQLDKKDNYMAIYPNAQMAEKITGICARNILQVANKTPFNHKGMIRKTAGGYKWVFESEVVKSEL